ncbi:MAG: single-stranded-DNA-specific exonuclease RecJ [Clostridiales bacterium]|nr:single-stranded-DNA-specific exonuclease RecJ [Clostridiales bacterium]
MKKKWVVAAKRADFNAIGAHFGVDPVIARIMRNRGMTELSEMELYLHGERKDLYDPHLLKDADRAAAILSEKIYSGQRIRILGDYDADGIQSTYILLKALRRVEASVSETGNFAGGSRSDEKRREQSAIDAVIPDRMRDGYGLNEHLVTRAFEDGVDTILTCDNGIATIEQIHRAKELGMTVIVTDHHEVPFEEKDGVRREVLPEADAIVNPKQAECRYPFPGLCGAAVAWKLVQVLYEQERIPGSEADVFLENVGFATVTDVMELQGENRILVKLGLERLRRTKNKGMRALILQRNLDADTLKCYHIGFVLGPCFNATGRLETAHLSLELLLCEDEKKAAVLAQEIIELNENRKSMTEYAALAAAQIIEEKRYDRDKVIVVFLPDCHESLAGIVAGRIRESYGRPAFVITRGEGVCKGSGRSVEAYSMYEEMCRCRELFVKFGGHPMAAGFSVREEDIDLLRERLNEQTALTEDELQPKITIDLPLPIAYLREDLVCQLEMLEPFGKGNEKPVFADRNLEITSLRICGKEGRVIQMKLKNAAGLMMDAVYFGDPENLRLSLEEKYDKVVARDTMNGRCMYHARMDFIYYPEIDHYYAVPRIKLKITDFA